MELLTYADISRLTGITVPTLQQWRHRGKLPPPDVNPNARVTLWYETTIKEWIENGSPGPTGS